MTDENANEYPADASAADGHPTTEYPTTEYPTAEYPVGGHSGTAAAGTAQQAQAAGSTAQQAQAAGSTAQPARARAAGPRIRWAGIVWGAIFSALALTVLVIVTSPDRVDAFGSWILALGPVGLLVVGVIALGAVVLVSGVLGAIRMAQRPRA